MRSSAVTEVRALEKRIRELKRVVGKNTLENEIPREALKAPDDPAKPSLIPAPA